MKYCWIMAALLAVALPVSATTQSQLESGLKLLKEKKYDQAESLFASLQKQSPSELVYLNNLAVAQMSQGKTELALESLKQALKANDQYAIAQQNLNQVYAFMASKAYSMALDKSFQGKLPELAIIEQVQGAPVAEAVAAANSKENTESKQIAVKPVEQTVVATASQENVASTIKQTLSVKTGQWITAWQSGDVAAYLGSYSEVFVPTNKLSYQQWKNQRRYRLKSSKNIQISYNQLQVYLAPDQQSAIVDFVQEYQDGNYRDKVRKQLQWKLENNNWLISREQVIEKL